MGKHHNFVKSCSTYRKREISRSKDAHNPYIIDSYTLDSSAPFPYNNKGFKTVDLSLRIMNPSIQILPSIIVWCLIQPSFFPFPTTHHTTPRISKANNRMSEEEIISLPVETCTNTITSKARFQLKDYIPIPI